MSREAADVVASVLRKHLPAGGHVDHMTGVVSVRCKACQVWIPDSSEHHGGFKAHVAAAVVAALGGLTRETRDRPEWFETGVMVQNRMIGGPDMVPERGLRFIPYSRWVSGWTPQEALSAPLPSPGGTHTNPTDSDAPRATGVAETTQGEPT